jgi:hypothetical protein
VFRNPKVGVKKTIRLLSERLAVCEGRLSEMIRKEVPARLASRCQTGHAAGCSTTARSPAARKPGSRPRRPASTGQHW